MGGLLHSVQRGGAWARWGPAQSPPRCTKCNSPPINGQCAFILLWATAQRKRATMLYFANVFIYLFIFFMAALFSGPG